MKMNEDSLLDFHLGLTEVHQVPDLCRALLGSSAIAYQERESHIQPSSIHLSLYFWGFMVCNNSVLFKRFNEAVWFDFKGLLFELPSSQGPS